MNTKSDDSTIKFLLGELSEEEQAQFEQRFLADNEFFEEVLATEDELIDQYLLDQLDEARRQRAEALFRSSPTQWREVEFKRQLLASLRETHVKGAQPTPAVRPPASAAPAPPKQLDLEEEPRPAQSEPEDSGRTFSIISTGWKGWMPQLTWVALALVCFSAAAWFLYRYAQKSSPEVGKGEVEREHQETPDKPREENRGPAETGGQVTKGKENREQPEKTVAQSQARVPNTISSIILAPATLERGAGAQTLTLKTETKRIRLQLELDESQRYDRYDILLTTFDGRKVWSKESLDAGQIKSGRLTLVLPSSLLEYEDYRIELKGLPKTGDPVHIADYTFKVRK